MTGNKSPQKYIPRFAVNRYALAQQKISLTLRNRAIKNIESECIYRGVNIDDLNETELEILIRNEEEKIKSKSKNNVIATLLVALGLSV